MAVDLAIVGCGNISYRHLMGLNLLKKKELDSFEIRAVCDIKKERAYKLGTEIRKFQGKMPKVYNSLESLLKNERSIDAVDVCTEHRTHHEVAIPLIESGKHVLVEKPLGVTMRACELINKAAKRNNIVLATAENLRRTILNRTIKWALDQNLIGKPRFLVWQEISYDLGVVDGTPWRHNIYSAGGGWTLDVGSHIGDLLLYLLGEVEEIYGKTAIFESKRYEDWPKRKYPISSNVEDFSTSILKFKKNVIGQWTSTKTAPGNQLLLRVIYGTEGSIGWEGQLKYSKSDQNKEASISLHELAMTMLNKLEEPVLDRLFPKGMGTRFTPSFWGDDASFALVLLDFAKAINENKKPEVDGIAGAKAEAIPMAILESSYLEEPVKVKDVENCKIESYQMKINKMLNIS